MSIENEELMHECPPEHLRMGTARWKYDKETEEEGKNESGKKYSGHEKSPVTLTCQESH